MQTMQTHPIKLLSVLFLFSSSSTLLNVGIVSGSESQTGDSSSPFTPKASLVRYWNKEIHNKYPKSQFLLSKASPLTAVDAASFAKLASTNSLATRLSQFCSSAGLLCFPNPKQSLEKHGKDSSFSQYLNKNFTNYATGAAGGTSAFKNYSDGDNLPVDSFRRYSRDAAGHSDKFANYAPDANVGDDSFNSYGAGATGSSGEFKNYNPEINVPNLQFNSYSDNGNGRAHIFTSYTANSNAGSENFASYGKNANGSPNEFSGYGENSNVIGSGFKHYGESGNGANDTFKSYGVNGNVPENNFNNYGDQGNSGVDTFGSYRDQSNVGDDSFQTYAKKSNAAKVNFASYGKSFNEGTDRFASYGKGGIDPQIAFKTYGINNTFKDYTKEGTVTFKDYTNTSSDSKNTAMKTSAESAVASGNLVNRWVEPGKFFREKMLKQGTVMLMPDIKDKMPKRSFLPRTIVSKLPFSASKLAELKQVFNAADNSTMESIIVDALNECERAPSPGETKRCVGSAEDMIDFATSVLGRNVLVRTTESTKGSKGKIMIGKVKGINGGLITKSVSCHQSLYPYLLYYCHSVPKVRVYEADILDPSSKAKINHGVAICHIDTSSWSPTHGAFLALGPGPGRIEVCHWIFENDMTWTIGDDNK